MDIKFNQIFEVYEFEDRNRMSYTKKKKLSYKRQSYPYRGEWLQYLDDGDKIYNMYKWTYLNTRYKIESVKVIVVNEEDQEDKVFSYKEFNSTYELADKEHALKCYDDMDWNIEELELFRDLYKIIVDN